VTIRRLSLAIALGLTILPLAARADDPPAAPPALPVAADAISHHAVTVDGRTLRYTARAGRTVLRDAKDEPAASLFSVDYTLDGATKATRPVAFLWNGGPGSSTLWLHMGSFAPLVVRTDGTGGARLPAALVPNDGTLLGTTDLVFVDAPGTGLSRVGGKGKPSDFYGVDQDARAFTQFVERWLTAHDRWGSPRFLIGESYGTTRAANVVDRLQAAGVGINGVVLISSALDENTLDPAPPGEDLSDVKYLPSEAAVAWYQNALPDSRPAQLEPFLAEVRRFAAGPYASALLQGANLDAATRRDIVAQLHRYLGLDETYIERADLRIDPTRFEKELLRGRGRLTGRLDGRFRGYDVDRTSDSPAYDPTLDSAIQSAFVDAFNRYLRDELNYRTELRYLPFNYAEVGGAWNYKRDANDVGIAVQTPDVIPDLAQALTRNPGLRVFSANGYFDLATPFFGTELDLAHLGIDPALRSHVSYGYYRSGHMIYLDPECRRRLGADIATWIRATLRS
jgi:carboxypeptidase C (cathepsin A)